jgi:methylated-DNA-[protein]-cysteine S-methyltransferase
VFAEKRKGIRAPNDFFQSQRIGLCEKMAHWTAVEGRLADGKPMRVYVAAHEGTLWAARVHDNTHPASIDEFVWSLSLLNKEIRWERGGSDVLDEAAGQLRAYFAGKRKRFAIPLRLRGTEFQKRVWQQLQEIPYGSMQSYGDIAEAVGNERACRAVGTANRKNNLGLFVPCHRVIAAGGKIGGYTGGLGIKTRLLAHEGAILDSSEKLLAPLGRKRFRVSVHDLI